MNHRHFLFIIFNLPSLLFSQVKCEISTGSPINICVSGEVILSASGNVNALQWTDEEGKVIGTNNNIKVNVDKNTIFQVVNKLTTGLELIVNGDFESGNTAFSSDYFESCVDGTMPQGAYCITNNSGLFHPGWSDCLGKSNSGNYLICDGAVVPNEKIWCQTVNVDQNKDYAFSAWITSVIDVAPPIMQFSINGSLLAQPFQSDVTPCLWQEFFEIWNSGNNTSAEICILNQSTIGYGNDFGIDNISLKEACFSKSSIIVNIIDSIKVDLGPDTSFCAGDDYVLKSIAHNTPANLNYTWSTGASGLTDTIQQPGTYYLTVSTPEGCSGTDSVVFTDIGLPVNTLPEDTSICFIAYPEVHLKADEAREITWYYMEIEDTGKVFPVRGIGTYTVVLSNGGSCSVRHQIEVADECSYNLYLPNAFTPNGDGLNDSFGPETFETYGYELTIFSRWGEKVFESTNSREKWDGTINGKRATTGVYVYFMNYTVVNYYHESLRKENQSGTVTLIR